MPYMEKPVDGLILIVATTVSVLHNAQNLSVFPWNSDYFPKLNISYRVGQVLDVAPTLQVIKVVLQVHNCRSKTINEPVQICNHGSPNYFLKKSDIHWFIHEVCSLLWFWNNWNPLVLRFILFYSLLVSPKT
jgi:hypothetical protein